MPQPDSFDPSVSYSVRVPDLAHEAAATVPLREVSEQPDEDASEVDYRLIDLIGLGGMGVVHLAEEGPSWRRVAFKRLRPERSDDRRARERLCAEARITGSLEHPHIVPVYQCGHDRRGRVFYTMRRIVGRDWSQAIDDQSLDERIRIWLGVADAIAYAHERGVIHCDLKPSNVVLGAFGEIHVVDWGLALLLETDGVRPASVNGSIGGTPAYLPPEIATADLMAIGPGVDVYLLGAILFEIITGRPPHSLADRTAMAEAARHNLLGPITDTPLSRIALKALATDPRDRHPDVATLREAVRAWRRHRRAEALGERAEECYRTACISSRDHDFNDALLTCREAQALWPDAIRERIGPADILEGWAEMAWQRGDYNLIVELGDQEELSARWVDRARSARSRDHRRRRLARRAGVALAFLAVIVSAVLGAGLVTVTDARAAADRRERQTRMDRTVADRQAEAARREQARWARATYASNMQAAWARWQADDGTDAQRALLACPAPLRGWEWRMLATRAVAERKRIALPDSMEDDVLDLSFSGDDALIGLLVAGERVVVHSSSHLAFQYACELPVACRRIVPHPAGWLAWGHQGAAVIRAGDVSRVKPLDFPGIEDTRLDRVYHLDGMRFLAGYADGAIRLVDFANDSISELPSLSSWIVGFSHDQEYLYAATRDSWSRIPIARRPEATWEQLPIIEGLSIRALSPGPDAPHAWLVNHGGSGARVFPGGSRAWVPLLGAPLNMIRISGNGLWSIAQDPGHRRWVMHRVAASTGMLRQCLSASDAIAVSGDGAQVATAWGGFLRIDHAAEANATTAWDTYEATSVRADRDLGIVVVGAANGAVLGAVYPAGGEFRLIRNRENRNRQTNIGHMPGYARDLVLAPTRDAIWLASDRGLEAVTADLELTAVPGHSTPLAAVARHPSQDRVAILAADGQVGIIDHEDTAWIWQPEAELPVACCQVGLTWMEDGRIAFYNGSDRIIVLEREGSGDWRKANELTMPVRAPTVVAADEGALVTAQGSMVHRYDAETGLLLSETPVPGGAVTALAMIDDHRRLVIGTRLGWVVVIDPHDWRTLAAWQVTSVAIEDFHWDAAADTLLVANRKYEVSVLGPGPHAAAVADEPGR